MTLVSVIIPVYNTENYIERCLNSVINQTLKDIEIICVNDGSIDKSLEILNKIKLIEPRIVIINLETNSGVSNARNVAIAKSKSPYLFFLDSDDTIEPECLEILYNDILKTNSDITMGAFNYYINNEYDSSNTTIVCDFLSNKNLDSKIVLTTIGGKMFSKEIIAKNQIEFNTNLTTYEDLIFTFECITYNASISAVPIGLYNYYLLRKNSATYNMPKQNTKREALLYFINSGIFNKLNDDNKITFLNTYMLNLIHWYHVYKTPAQKKQIREIYKYMRKNIEIRLLKQCSTYIGIKNISKNLLENILSLRSWQNLLRKF
ncbi:MAG: glycosyltransferase [Cyanobacteria bacterium SIG28]|nr:glycosyltransferase [Cyanobacteria bacterium SIG28]